MSDTETVKPALTPEEWASRQFKRDHSAGHIADRVDVAIDDQLDVLWVGAFEDDGTPIRGADRHALAALALYGQPFGFTREEVANLREVIGEAQDNGNRQWPGIPMAEHTLAKIEALLPPE